MLELKNVFKTYKNGSEESIVVNDISLKIEEGDFISIIGQSGSGKSKLLHLIGGLDTPTSGSIIYNNTDISNLNDKEISKYRRDIIGFIFQDFNLEGNKTVYENVLLPMIFAKVNPSDRKERVMKALEKVNLLDKANNKVSELSGGQKQRVTIARALINNAKILLADEPTGNLDTKNGLEIISLLQDLNSKGFTIIMVTHNLEQTLSSNKTIKIKDGKIVNIKDNKLEEVKFS